MLLAPLMPPRPFLVVLAQQASTSASWMTCTPLTLPPALGATSSPNGGPTRSPAGRPATPRQFREAWWWWVATPTGQEPSGMSTAWTSGGWGTHPCGGARHACSRRRRGRCRAAGTRWRCTRCAVQLAVVRKGGWSQGGSLLEAAPSSSLMLLWSQAAKFCGQIAGLDGSMRSVCSQRCLCLLLARRGRMAWTGSCCLAGAPGQGGARR